MAQDKDTTRKLQKRAARDDDVIDLMRLIRALWRHAWMIIVFAVVCGGLMFTRYAYFVEPTYTASAKMYVNNSDISVGSTSFSISSSDLTAAQSLVDTYAIILQSRITLEQVIEEAELDYTYEELVNMVSVSAVNETEIFSIAVTSTSPTEAALIANTITNILPDTIADVVDGSSVRIVDNAVVPASKSAPNITKYTLMGLLAGAAVACFIIIVLELMDDLIHNEDYLLQTYNVPVLATIPDLKSSKSSKGSYYYENYGNATRKDE